MTGNVTANSPLSQFCERLFLRDKGLSQRGINVGYRG